MNHLTHCTGALTSCYFYVCSRFALTYVQAFRVNRVFLYQHTCSKIMVVALDHFLSEKVMVFDNFLAADMHK